MRSHPWKHIRRSASRNRFIWKNATDWLQIILPALNRSLTSITYPSNVPAYNNLNIPTLMRMARFYFYCILCLGCLGRQKLFGPSFVCQDIHRSWWFLISPPLKIQKELDKHRYLSLLPYPAHHFCRMICRQLRWEGDSHSPSSSLAVSPRMARTDSSGSGSCSSASAFLPKYTLGQSVPNTNLCASRGRSGKYVSSFLDRRPATSM